MNRRPLVSALVFLATLVAGCGGHGGGGGESLAEQNKSTGRDACALTMFAPNYASGIDLSYWPQFPVQVYFDTTSARYTPDLQTRAIAAFNGWVDQTGERVAYVVVTDPLQADISVGFVPLADTALSDYDADGITYFDSPRVPRSGTLDSQFGYVRIYIGINGMTTRENGTMGHEFGHALGIHGHSPDENDIMYYAYTPDRSPTPTTRDVNTLYTAYCGVFRRSQAASGRAVTLRRHAPMPPLTDPGWQAIK